MDPGTGTLLNLAACHEAEGKIATAWAEFGEAARMAKRDNRADREQYALEHAAAIEPKIPRLVMEVAKEASDLPSLEIKIDDVEVGRVVWTVPAPIDPGHHVLVASAKGKQTFHTEFDILLSPEPQKVAVPPMEDEPVTAAEAGGPAAGGPAATPGGADHAAKDGSGQRTLGLAVGGGGVVVLGVGAFFGLRAFSKWGERNDHCPDGQCDATAVSAGDAAKSSALIADITVGVGLVAVGVGAYLFFSAPSGEEKPATGWVGLGSVAGSAPGVTAGGRW